MVHHRVHKNKALDLLSAEVKEYVFIAYWGVEV
jgi:hypothetical protein